MRSSVLYSVGLISTAGVSLAQTYPSRTWGQAQAQASAIVAQLTTAEKISLTYGEGQFGGACTGNIPALSRLNISSICMNDGPAGMRGVDLVSGFPAGITTAATWNKDLIKQRAIAIGQEYRTKGSHVWLGPAMDVMRTPEAGRLWESFGADSYLTGEAVYATVQGIQSVGVQACAKHLIANSQESYRYTYSSVVDQRTLMEKYYVPFQRAIDADVSAVMCSYNLINGTYACENPATIGDSGLVKGHSGFKGYVVSDWGATHDNASIVANAGLDLEMPGDWIVIGGGVFAGSSGLSSAVSSGAVSTTRLNEMVARILTPYYFLGQDSGFPATNYNVQSATSSQNLHVNARSTAHTNLIKEIANAGAVLLKNTNNVLPFSASSPPKKIAVIGLDAAPTTGCTLNQCDNGTLSVGWGSGTNSLTYLVAPVTALENQVIAGGNKTTLIESITNDQTAAVTAATGADAAIVFVNADSGEFDPLLVNLSGGDRINLHSGPSVTRFLTFSE